MRTSLLLFLSFYFFPSWGQSSDQLLERVSPLSAFSDEWDGPAYQVCNTAATTAYLTKTEKEIIYILNLARMNPSLFARTVVKVYPAHSEQPRLEQSSYYKSLLVFLQNKKPLPLVYPEKDLYYSAQCHAETSGAVGYVGHDRRGRACRKLEKFAGECCHYGSDDPLTIVMDLLIDEGVPSLGHRYILFTPHTRIGVSLQPHQRYQWNAVLDLM